MWDALPNDVQMTEISRALRTPILQVHVELGPASEGIAHLAQQGVRWDLAFIDADKTGYLGYYKQVCILY